MSDTTTFEALTGAIGQALALFGGCRQTRLVEQAELGADMFHVEHLEDWPASGRISVGGITYTYARRTVDTLLGLKAIIGGTPVAGAAAQHTPLSGVLDLSETYSELDALRGSLFLPTAGGEDLAVLGRGFGVPRDESLSGDEQYRQVIRSIAYAPATSLAALERALDALLGPGAYSIDEDPVGSPGKVFISVDYASHRDVSPIGRAYLAGLTTLAPEADGTLLVPAEARAPVPLLLAPYDVAQSCTQALPSAANGWTWQAATESSDCQMVAEGAQGRTASLTNLTSSYVTQAPTFRPGTTSRLSLLVQVVNPGNLATSGIGCGASISDGERTIAWNITGPSPQVALVGPTGVALAGPLALDPGYRHLALTLEASGATLRVDGRLALRVSRNGLSSSSRNQAAFGNLSRVGHSGSGGSAPQMRLRWLGILARDPRDYLLSRGADAAVSAPRTVKLGSLALPARAVGSHVWLSGATKATAAGGTANGQYRVASIAGASSAVLEGIPHDGGALVRAADGSSYLVAGSDGPLTFPDDLGKTVVVTAPAGAGVAGSYTVLALYDPSTGRDLTSFATRLKTRSFRAKLGGAQVLATDNITYRVDPVFVADAATWLLNLKPQAVKEGSSVRWTLAQPLPLPQARYTVPLTSLLGCQLEADADTQTVQTDPGPPPLYDRYPLYLASPFEAVESYLPSLTAAGVQAILRFR